MVRGVRHDGGGPDVQLAGGMVDKTMGRGRGRVLIVDDNVALAENIAEVLGFEGFETEVAATGEEALPMALCKGLTFVVTDFRLPGIDGADLVDRVLRATKDVRCIVISGQTDEQTMDRARDAGAHFFAKPVNLAGLIRLMCATEGTA
jgi:DNA-binding response OmpR family regulator